MKTQIFAPLRAAGDDEIVQNTQGPVSEDPPPPTDPPDTKS
jgi:hypothetical protein